MGFWDGFFGSVYKGETKRTYFRSVNRSRQQRQIRAEVNRQVNQMEKRQKSK